jgi:hypothetical protein
MDCNEQSKDRSYADRLVMNLQITLEVGNSLTSGVTGSFIKGNCTVWGLSCVCVNVWVKCGILQRTQSLISYYTDF